MERICEHCGQVIKGAAVKEDGMIFHYLCAQKYFGIKLSTL